MIFWVEPRGFSSPCSTGRSEPYFETRRFIVIRSKRAHCLCLAVHTYRRKGTSKYGIVPDQHAAVIAEKDLEASTHLGEKKSNRDPIQIILETKTLSIDATSTIDFTRVYTVEYNLPVRNIGRIRPLDLALFETYFGHSVNILSLDENVLNGTDDTSSLDGALNSPES